MEKRSWLWKKKSYDKSPGETESSGSMSSHSERYSDEQESLKDSSNSKTQSPEVTSKVMVTNEEVNDTVKNLTEKLSAALVNVGAKEELVKQHAKVAEEAIAGWEKAENEVAALRQQLEAAVEQNLALEVRVSHLDGALKECVRQQRQARDEHEQRIQEALAEKTREREFDQPCLVDPNVLSKLESLEKEKLALKYELLSRSEELEIRTIERDLSTQAAETASKQNLESIKKVARLEAECRRLQAAARKISFVNDHKSVSASSLYVESFTDSQSDAGERLNAVEVDRVGRKGCETSCSDSWASALIAELDHFKNEKGVPIKNLTSCSIELDIMDDFLEMEKLAALPEIESKSLSVNQSNNVDNSLRAEFEAMSDRVAEFEAMSNRVAEFEAMSNQVAELEDKLEKIEGEKAELVNTLNASRDSLEAAKAQLRETESRLEELQKEVSAVIESKELLEFQVIDMEVESRTMSAEIDLLKAEVERERSLLAEMAAKSLDLEEKLTRRTEEVELQQNSSSNSELKVKQEDLAVAADKLAECQKTIASLGRQLKSLATLEDFLIDTTNLPNNGTCGELWKLHSNDSYTPKTDSNSTKLPGENSDPSLNDNIGELPAVSSAVVGSGKSRNGFGKLFSRSKNGTQLENH